MKSQIIKKFKNSFFMYLQEQRSKIDYKKASQTDFIREHSQKWKEMSPEDKKKYIELGKEELNKFKENKKNMIYKYKKEARRRKRSKTAFNFYLISRKNEIKNGDVEGIAALQQIGKDWKALNMEQKDKFIKLAEEDKRKFKEEENLLVLINSNKKKKRRKKK